MSYIDQHLLPGERVSYRATLSKAIFLWPALVALFGLWNLTFLPVTFLLGPVVALYVGCVYKYSEYAVTDKRVLVKLGVFRRRSIEILLSKIEGITVDQGIIGRMCGYGTVMVNGIGGTKEPFKMIADPFDFRRRVQEQIGQVAK